MNKVSVQERVQRQRQVLFWATMAIVLVLAVLALQEILLPFVAGSVLAYALNPIADRLEQLGMGRLAASAIVVLVLLVIFAVVLIILVPMLLQQAQQIMASLPSDIESIRPAIEDWSRQKLGGHFETVRAGIEQGIHEAQKNWASLAGTVAQGIWDRGWALVDFFAIILVTPVVVFYLLVDWPTMLKRIGELLPRDHETTIKRVLRDIDAAMAAFIRGQGLVCLILGSLYTIGLSIIELRYGLLVGIVTGILVFIPIVGSAVGLLAASLLALIQGWPDPTLLFLVIMIFAAGQILDASLLTPRVVGPTVGLHPVALIFALFVFSYLFGFVGALVAVPMAAAIGVLIRFGLEVYLHSSIYKGSRNSLETKKKKAR